MQVLAVTLGAVQIACAQAISPQDTLDVVNWNLEFFGDTPSELPQEMEKTKTIMNNLDADIYALVEVVNTDSLHSLVQSLNGSYNYIVSPFGSFASSPTGSQYASAQKLAFVYRTSMVKNVSGRALLKNSLYAYDYWSSGRFPYLVTAEVLGKDNLWRTFQFVIIHAKANSDYNSCLRRYAGALELKDTLDNHYSSDRLMILGDFNDDLDVSICSSFSESTFAGFVKDSSDANSYKAVTMPLSQAGQSSIYGYSSFLDHVVISNEVVPYYVPGSAELLKSKVTSWVTSYTNYVSDHYPVKTRYVMDQTTAVKGTTALTAAIYPIPAGDILYIRSNDDHGSYEIFDMNGQKIISGIYNNKITGVQVSFIPDGIYFIRLSGTTGTVTRRIIIARS